MLKNIRFGIKIAIKNFDWLPEIYAHSREFDFIEVIFPPNFTAKDIKMIKNLELPYTIHLPNSNYGIDLGDVKRVNENSAWIKRINKFSDKLDELKPICYIIHPESGDIELSIINIKKLKIKPIALENMPVKGIYGGELLGYDPNSLRTYFERIHDLEFCFDITHAIKAAFSMKIDHLSFIRKFLEFKKPILFHISGGTMNVEVDEHFSLEKGEYNLSEIKNFLFNCNYNINLTLETPKNFDIRILEDLKNQEFFKNA